MSTWHDVTVSPERCASNARAYGLLAASYARASNATAAYLHARIAATWYAAHEELQAPVERTS